MFANGTTYYIGLPSPKEGKGKTKTIVTTTENFQVCCNKLGVQFHKNSKIR